MEAQALALQESVAVARVGELSLHEAQRQIVREAKRFNVASCGRRIGKTILGVDLLAAIGQAGEPCAYFAPTYKMLAETWAELVEVTRPVQSKLNVQERRIELTTGGKIDCWSFQAPNSARGRKYKRVVIDEAAHSPGLKKYWQAVIRPTLTDLKGDGWFLSTPNGMNDFWQLYQLGLDPLETAWMCWQMPTSRNPYIDATEIEAARRELPESVFSQEYLAEFLEDGGAVFRNLAACTTAELQETGERTHRYVIGVDWAKIEDFSVMTVIDCTNGGEVCYTDRFNNVEYMLQVDRLSALCERFDPVLVVSERTGNLALAELLRRCAFRSRREGQERTLPLWDFDTTNARKQEAIQALALAFERRQIRIPDNSILRAELQAFTAERTPSGLIHYGAPEGLHDDCVMSLALTWWAARRVGIDGILTTEDKIEMLIDPKYRKENIDPADTVQTQGRYYAVNAAKKLIPTPSQGRFTDVRNKYRR